MTRLTLDILLPEVQLEDVGQEPEGGVSGRADCKISARLVPVQFSLAAVSLTNVISSEIPKAKEWCTAEYCVRESVEIIMHFWFELAFITAMS